MKEERNKPQTFSAYGWTGESKIYTNVVRKWTRTPLTRAKNNKKKWAEWLVQGEEEGDKGPRTFVPVGGTNRDQRPPFCPGWWLQPGPKALVPPACPASRWTRDKSHFWSRAQRQSGQMAWIKGLFCNSIMFFKKILFLSKYTFKDWFFKERFRCFLQVRYDLRD